MSRNQLPAILTEILNDVMLEVVGSSVKAPEKSTSGSESHRPDVFRFFVNVAGVPKESINLEYKENQRLLEITGQNKIEDKDIVLNCAIAIPEEADMSNLQAQSVEGMLVIRIPRTSNKSMKFTIS